MVDSVYNCAETNENQFFDFQFLDMDNFVLKFRILIMLGGLRPSKPLVLVGGFTSHRGLRHQATEAFGFYPLSQLTLGYHSLAFLNQVRKSL